VSHALVDRFLAHLAPPLRAKIEHAVSLEQGLVAACDAARQAWPQLAVEPADFVAYLAERIPTNVDPLEALERLHVGDLYLACACASGAAEAIAAFEEHVAGSLGHAIGRLRLSPTAAEELRQVLREQLFVGSGGAPPLLRSYSGRGQLRGWLRIIAARTAGRMIDRGNRELLLTNSVLAGLAPSTPDPELDHLKATYRAEFADAFQSALGALTARERNLLAQHYLDGLSIDEIGLIYGVHRATIARWLARSRTDLLKRTRSALMRRLRIDRSGYESIMRLIESQLPVSFPPGGEPEPDR
jgi:RNA polymerase sigma-70 factor (ECF subfamily)